MNAQTAVNKYALDPYGTDTYHLATVANLDAGDYVPGFGTITDAKPDDALPGYIAIRYDLEAPGGGTEEESASMPQDWAIYIAA